jgi:non-homologous end joining protein Ku
LAGFNKTFITSVYLDPKDIVIDAYSQLRKGVVSKMENVILGEQKLRTRLRMGLLSAQGKKMRVAIYQPTISSYS